MGLWCYANGNGKVYTTEDMIHFKRINKEEVEDLIRCLEAATNTKDSVNLSNRVKTVLVHDDWYSKKQSSDVMSAAKESLGLTSKQKKFNLPMVQEPRYDSD